MNEVGRVGSIITVMNMKGGVGKTTVAMHVGGVLGRYKIGSNTVRKVLLIDYDPQFNLSQAFLPPKTYFDLEKQRKTILYVLLDDDAALNPYQLQVPCNHTPPKPTDVIHRMQSYKDGGCLDILPSTLDLMYVALGQADAQTKPIEEPFEKFIDSCRELYDVVIIDCHPAGSLFTKTSLRNSDHVIIPVVPQRYAVRGIGLMMNFLEAKKRGSTGPTPHILFNCTSRSGTTREEIAIRADAKYSSYCLTKTLKRYKAFGEPEGGTGFVWHSGKPYSGSAFYNLWEVVSELVPRTKV